MESLGTLAHELRNALNRATVSSEMIAKGIVGVGGSTSRVLQYSLTEMHRLIDGALSEVRLRSNSETLDEQFYLNELISQLVVTADIEASRKALTLTLQVDPEIEVTADRHLLLSALGNLVQNAIKFTASPGNITIVAKREGETAVIEVRDQCGGIPPNRIDEMFKPFVQQGEDRSGLGLGLTISRKAVEKCRGSLSAHNIDGGCVFRIALPLLLPRNVPPIPPVV